MSKSRDIEYEMSRYIVFGKNKSNNTILKEIKIVLKIRRRNYKTFTGHCNGFKLCDLSIAGLFVHDQASRYHGHSFNGKHGHAIFFFHVQLPAADDNSC